MFYMNVVKEKGCTGLAEEWGWHILSRVLLLRPMVYSLGLYVVDSVLVTDEGFEELTEYTWNRATQRISTFAMNALCVIGESQRVNPAFTLCLCMPRNY